MMGYHELIDALTCEGKNALDYIDEAVEWLEHMRSELAATNERCKTLGKLLTEYQDELIPSYRERAEKAETRLSQYTASGLEPCDYAAMRSAFDGEKEAKHALSSATRLLAAAEARAEKAESIASDLCDDFTNFVTGGIHNAAPYCENCRPECANSRGWCNGDNKVCRGFLPKAAVWKEE